MAGWLTAAGLAIAAPTISTLKLSDCRLDSTVARGAIDARCGWYEVAENRDRTGNRIRIHVAVIPALRREALPDPLFIISGGPGQAASDFYLSSRSAFEGLRRDRDLVVIDQRGTGKSGRLDCELPDELESARFDKELLQRYARECLAKLSGDPRFYTTSVAVRDLNEIRHALGYGKINLYGISYGTRVVQHYARRYPQHVRASVLDGVVPVEVALGPEVAIGAQATLEALFKRCGNRIDCRQAFPNIAAEFAQLRTTLAERTLPIALADPRTAKPISLQFSSAHLAIALRLLSYSDDTASLLPFLIHEAAQGRPQAMAAQALLVAHSLKDQMAIGMQNAVVCTEDVPFLATDSHDAAIATSYMGSLFIDSLRATCEVWPRGVVDADFHAPLQSDVPTLLTSGENDPITPVRYGQLAAKNFKQSKHVVFGGQGHGQLMSRCGASLIRRFIETGSPNDLDTKCVEQIAPTPFMLDANGPSP